MWEDDAIVAAQLRHFEQADPEYAKRVELARPPCNAGVAGSQPLGGPDGPRGTTVLLNEGVCTASLRRQRRCALAERYHCPPGGNKPIPAVMHVYHHPQNEPEARFNAVSIPDTAPARFPSPC